MTSVPIPPDDIKLIEVLIDSMSTENNDKKLDINDIIKLLDTFHFYNKLDKYKPFIIEYTNQRNREAEVMHINFLFNHTFIHIIILYTDYYFH